MPTAVRPAPLVEMDRVRGLLARAGHAWTRPRSGILHVLVRVAMPLTADEIHERLSHAPGGRGINLSSVYRTLGLFAVLGIVRRISVLDGARRYELAKGYRAHHHHLVCEACGRIEDIRRCPVAGADWGIPGGALVRSHHLELYGYCRRCAPAVKEE